MTYISPASSTQGAGTQQQTAASPASQLANPNIFLQLLVAELKYQNPLSPVSGANMMQQSAELSQVEMVTQMSQDIQAQQQALQVSTASGLIGKQVQATLSDGSKVSGAVSSIQLSSGGSPVLTVNGTQVPLSAVTQVS